MKYARTATIPLNTWTQVETTDYPSMDLCFVTTLSMRVAVSETTPDANTPYLTTGPQAASDNIFTITNKPNCIWFYDTASGTGQASLIARY